MMLRIACFLVTASVLAGCNQSGQLSQSLIEPRDEVIAVIGTGDMGDSIGPRFAELGFKVVYGSRTPDSEKVTALVAKTGNGAVAKGQLDAAQMGDIVVLAVPWPAMETVATSIGNLDGKIIIDVSMPWDQADDGYPIITVPTSSAELIQEWNPGAKVVKALATIGSQIIDDPQEADGVVTMPVASDHRDAKERVAAILAELGYDPVDFGPLRMAREMESLQVIWLIPVLQRRDAAWEFYFRRSKYYPCIWQDDWRKPVYDAENLPNIPETQSSPGTCP